MKKTIKLAVKIIDPIKAPPQPGPTPAESKPAPLTTPPPSGPDSTAEQPRIVDPGPV